MKQALLALLLTGVSLLDARATEGAKLEVRTAAGQIVALDSQQELAVKFWLQQLALSALYRNVVQKSSADEWTSALQSGAAILCHYPASSMIALPERSTLTFDEILVPVPAMGAPPYAYLRHGASYRRLAKYDPWVLEKLKLEATLSTKLEPAIARGLF